MIRFSKRGYYIWHNTDRRDALQSASNTVVNPLRNMIYSREITPGEIMWRYLDNVSQPVTKKPKLDESVKKDKSKEYDREKRKRTFQASWQNGRQWLAFREGKMFCTYCAEFSNDPKMAKSTFVQGSMNFKLESILSHEKGEHHKKSESLYLAKQAGPSKSMAEMKMIKTDWRSTLRPQVLSDLLFIMFHTEEIKNYDPTDAIHLWNVSGSRVRRPCQKPYGARAIDQDDECLDVWTELDPII